MYFRGSVDLRALASLRRRYEVSPNLVRSAEKDIHTVDLPRLLGSHGMLI